MMKIVNPLSLCLFERHRKENDDVFGEIFAIIPTRDENIQNIERERGSFHDFIFI